MQKTKTIQISNRSFTLKELPVRVIWELINNNQTKKKVNMLDSFQDLLKLACPELTAEVLLTLYPSEIEELWQGFEEVNAAFLGVIRRIGLIDILTEEIKPIMRVITDGFKPILEEELKKAAAEQRISINKSASSLPEATVPESGTTATASS